MAKHSRPAQQSPLAAPSFTAAGAEAQGSVPAAGGRLPLSAGSNLRGEVEEGESEGSGIRLGGGAWVGPRVRAVSPECREGWAVKGEAEKKREAPSLQGPGQVQEVLGVPGTVRGRQEFGTTAPSAGLVGMPQGHLPTLLPSPQFTPSPFISATPGEDSQDKEASPRISCPKGSKVYGGYCYALFTITKSWMDADVSDWVYM